MSVHFIRQIDKLKRLILKLGTMVQDQVDNAIACVLERDAVTAKQIIAGDREIDFMEIEVEEECLHTLALHQPVAFDLRYVVAVLKINNDLERIADLAVNMAEQAVFLTQEVDMEDTPFDLPAMARLVKSMVRDALRALVDVDTGLAQRVREMDDQVDAIHAGVYDRIAGRIHQDPFFAEQLIHYLSISRQLERIADHAVNIAEDVLYTSEGEIYRHQQKVQEQLRGRT